MAKVSFKMEQIFCEECSLALRRFIGHMKGVESIEVQDGGIAVEYDSEKISDEQVARVVRESVEKLGYKLE